MRRSAVASLFALGFALGCGDVTAPHSDVDGGEDAVPGYVGVWQVAGGELWAGPDQELLYLELAEGGKGQLYSRFSSGVLTCGRTLLHARLSGSVVSIDLRAFGLRAYV